MEENKISSTSAELENSLSVQGMINKVHYLVKSEI